MKKEKIIKFIDIFILAFAGVCLAVLILVYVNGIEFPVTVMIVGLLAVYIAASGIKQILYGNKKIGIYLIAFMVFVIAIYIIYQLAFYYFS